MRMNHLPRSEALLGLPRRGRGLIITLKEDYIISSEISNGVDRKLYLFFRNRRYLKEIALSYPWNFLTERCIMIWIVNHMINKYLLKINTVCTLVNKNHYKSQGKYQNSYENYKVTLYQNPHLYIYF